MHIKIKVTPNAKNNSIKKERDLLTDEEIYMIRITAQPIGGAANKALIQYLADHFDVPKRKIHITQGDTSRWKRVHIED